MPSLSVLLYVQVGPSGRAVGIDHIPELVEDSVKNVKKDPELVKLMDSGQMKLVAGDGRKGYEQDGPYDAIHVGAAAAILPQPVRKFITVFGFFF